MYNINVQLMNAVDTNKIVRVRLLETFLTQSMILVKHYPNLLPFCLISVQLYWWMDFARSKLYIIRLNTRLRYYTL